MTTPPDPTRTGLDERYADLLDGDGDRTLTEFVGVLDRAYATAAPPHVRAAFTGDSAVPQPDRSRVTPPPSRRARRRTLLRAAAVLAAAAIVGGGVAAASPPVHDVFGELMTFLHIEQSGSAPLGQPIDVSRTYCGFTLTLTRVYADNTMLVVGYRVVGPAGQVAGPFSGDLMATDSTGKVLPVLPASRWGGGRLRGMATVGPFPVAIAFDAHSAARPSGRLAVHLTVPRLYSVGMIADTGSFVLPCAPREAPVFVPGNRPGYGIILKAPFAVDLSVPITPATPATSATPGAGARWAPPPSLVQPTP